MFLIRTRLLESSDVGEENAWEYDSLTKVCREEIHNVFPAGVVVVECCHYSVTDYHQETTKTDEVIEHSPAAHDGTCYEAANWGPKGGNDEPHASLGC